MAKTFEQMKKELLERTKKNYDRREPDMGSSFIDRDKIGDLKIWRAAPTKGNPHIVDIIPFIAGDNFPQHNQIEEGNIAYCLDLWVHQNVGPSKSSVICPAKNYGEPCPICDEVEELVKEGVEWKDIPIVPKRRVIYNVVVMDDEKTESAGVQIWDVSYKYMEDPILALSKSARTGGVIAFAAPDKIEGKSIAFDVGNDTYRKITGHRFEARDYDIPKDILEQAVQLDQILIIMSEDEIKKILYGSGGGSSKEEHEEKEECSSSRRSRTTRTEPDDVQDPEPEPKEEKKERRSLTKREPAKAKETTCPFGDEHFGADYDEYQECEECEFRQECCERKDAIELEAEKKEKEQEKPKRRPLNRR